MKQLLHTPEGVRDIYYNECEKKLTLQERLHNTLHLYGYHDIQTPTFEFFDVFRKEIGTIPSKELYKFFDREGNTLVLRPDITPSVARAAATLLPSDDLPVRICYMGNTFINHSSYQGRLKENTQLGAELMGFDSVEADAEMLSLVVDALLTAGLKEFQVNIGHVDFFEGIIEQASLDEETEMHLRELIINRNYFGVEELLYKTVIDEKLKNTFQILPELVGGIDVLELAKQYAPNTKAKAAINRLTQIYEILIAYGVEQYVSFDLSMSGSYGYYTGIIFRGYTFGTGDAILKGGRYDHLLEKFGKKSPSIGFAIIIDELMNALTRQQISIPQKRQNTLIIYDDVVMKKAIDLAKDFRDKGKNTELIKRDQNKNIEEYMNYGKNNFAITMLYLQKNNQIEMINLVTDERKTVICDE